MNKLVFIFILALFFSANDVSSQESGRELTTSIRRAEQAYSNAFNQLRMRNVQGAKKEFLRAIEIDPYFVEPYVVLGELSFDTREYEKCIEYNREAIRIDKDFYPNKHYYLSICKLRTGDYENSKSRIKTFLQYEDISEGMESRAEAILETCRFAIEAKKNPVPFDPINIGDNINTENAEYSPSLTADESTIYFTRKRQRETKSVFESADFEDLYSSVKVDGVWQPAENIGSPVNTSNNEGFLSISADGQHLFYTACNRPEGVGSCDIYYSRRRGGKWDEPENMGTPVNSSRWDSQPSSTADGKILYFSSARAGSFGEMDIWRTEFNEQDSTWKTPVNLGTVINTTGSEMSPFIHPDDQTLYFASDGHQGMGGLDIFYSRRGEDGKWQKPVNLGYPINTHRDEFALFVGASGKTAYFASDFEQETGQTDIYYFELYEEARPDPLTYMRGKVYDKYTGEPLEANFEVIDLKTDRVIITSSSDETDGSFLISIPTGVNVGINASKEGYLFFSENFSFDKAYTGIEPYHADIPLRPIKTGESTILRNIFFEYDKYELKPESKAELNRLVEMLKNNPDVNIEIGGHTDSIGSYEYNINLSLNRAKSVYNYLVEKGISSERLKYKGYADTKPVDTNETEEGRANNRRTEFTIL